MLNEEKIKKIKTDIEELKIKKTECEEKLMVDLNLLKDAGLTVPIVAGFKFGDDQFGKYIDFIVLLQYDEEEASYIEYCLTKLKIADYTEVINKYGDNVIGNEARTDIAFRYYI